jgi:hypothetical protein
MHFEASVRYCASLRLETISTCKDWTRHTFLQQDPCILQRMQFLNFIEVSLKPSEQFQGSQRTFEFIGPRATSSCEDDTSIGLRPKELG